MTEPTAREQGKEVVVNRTGNVLIYVGTIMMCLGFPAKLSDKTALGLGVGGVFVLLLGIYMSLGKGARQTVRNKAKQAGGAVGGKVRTAGVAVGTAVGNRVNHAVTSGLERLASSQPVPQTGAADLPAARLHALRDARIPAYVSPAPLTGQNVVGAAYTGGGVANPLLLGQGAAGGQQLRGHF